MPVFVLPTSAQSSVVIGEVQWAGSERSSADEWIELWNLGNASSSLSGFRLRGVGGGHDLVFEEEQEIGPQQSFVIANYHAEDLKTTLILEASIVTTTLSITNEKTSIELMDSMGTIIDRVQWESSAPAGSTSIPKSSMIRSFQDSSLPWFSPTTSQNLSTSTIQYGSPGICDACLEESSLRSPKEPTQVLTSSSTTTTKDEVSRPDTEEEPLPPIEIPEPEFVPEAERAVDDFPPSPSSTEFLLEKSSAFSTAASAPGTSKEEILAQEQLATSTDTLLPTLREENISTTTSTPSPEPLFVSEHLVTTSTLLAPESVVASTPSPIPETSFPAPIPLPRVESWIRFQEVYPAPSTGPEWVELALGSAHEPTNLTGWTIRDDKKTLLTIQPTTKFSWNKPERLLLFSLASGKLPNKGATLFLVDPLGTTRDQVAYPALPKNHAWARSTTSTDLWMETEMVTPGTQNKIVIARLIQEQALPLTTPSVSSAHIKEPEPKLTTPPLAVDVPSVPLPRTPTSTIRTIALSNPSHSSKKREMVAHPTQKTITTPKTPSLKKTPAKKNSPSQTPPLFVDLKHLGPMHASTRVRVTGTVATLPRLLGNNAFVIQTNDGRGLYVSGNTKQTRPPFRSHIELTGTLSLNDDGLILHMYASDRWRILEPERAVQTRVPDLDQPSLEDAWSYVRLRGIVSEVSATRITMLHDQSEINISVRPVVRYRTERLKKGDEIEVSGLLDTRKDSLLLLPRLADEIHLIQAAPIKASTNPAETQTPSPLPWMPVGVAGVSIAATQGVRRYWKYRLERKIRFPESH